MAFLGIFGKKSEGGAVRKHAERVANKRAQAYDRWESIQALSGMKSRDAVEALLPRFTFYVEPSITDQEEKDAAFAGILEAGAEGVEPVVAFLKRADSISWPVKMLNKLVDEPTLIGYLLELLAKMDVEYARDTEVKTQILTVLAERKDARASEYVVRFLEDANESARFAAVGALIGQEAVAQHKDALVKALCLEDSVRVRNRVFEALASAGLSVQPEQERVKARLTPGYTLDNGFVPRRRA